jgi:hypothetical protein
MDEDIGLSRLKHKINVLNTSESMHSDDPNLKIVNGHRSTLNTI